MLLFHRRIDLSSSLEWSIAHTSFFGDEYKEMKKYKKRKTNGEVVLV
jgi:hypothetical protein